MVMKDATPLTPQAYEQNSIFKCKQHTVHDLGGPEKYNITMWYSVFQYVNYVANIFGKVILSHLKKENYSVMKYEATVYFISYQNQLNAQ